jgi:ribonuclease BN (tRNA processing enzyme)
MKLKVYGCRASVASGPAGGSRYGSNTSCFLLISQGQHLIIDAGSGIMQLQEEYTATPFRPDILLSHLHLDHTIGLTTFEAVWHESSGTRIFTKMRSSEPLAEQVFGAFSPPYWPAVMAKATHAKCVAIENGVAFQVGTFTVTPFAAAHANDTTSFHITDGQRTVVYLLDSELPMMDKPSYDALVGYCADADMVVFDAAYTPEEYPRRKSWGHSTVKEAVELKQASGCKQILLSHFAHRYSDEMLDAYTAYPGAEGFLMAREGAEIKL